MLRKLLQVLGIENDLIKVAYLYLFALRFLYVSGFLEAVIRAISASSTSSRLSNQSTGSPFFFHGISRKPRSQGLSSFAPGGKMRDPGNEVVCGYVPTGVIRLQTRL